METATDPAKQLAPPNEYEAAILGEWLRVSARTEQTLVEMNSPWSEYISDFCSLLYDVLHPEEAGQS